MEATTALNPDEQDAIDMSAEKKRREMMVSIVRRMSVRCSSEVIAEGVVVAVVEE